MEASIFVYEDASELAQEAARRIARQAVAASRSRGRFSVALSGGSTPGSLYRLLAENPYRGQIPWADVHIFWGDERCVPADDPGSNYGQAVKLLLSQVPIPSDNVHRVQGELDPPVAARLYDAALQRFFCGPRIRFDLVLLGLGTDGHTASLFPGSDALEEKERWTAAAENGDPSVPRVTLTLPVLNNAAAVLFLVAGSAKAGVLASLLSADPPDIVPARRVRPPHGDTIIFADQAAVAGLSPGSR